MKSLQPPVSACNRVATAAHLKASASAGACSIASRTARSSFFSSQPLSCNTSCAAAAAALRAAPPPATAVTLASGYSWPGGKSGAEHLMSCRNSWRAPAK